MKFIITGVGEKCFALYDVENKGSAMATAYTIKQLVEAGHQVVGVKSMKPFSVVCHCKNGDVAKKQPVRATGIPDTKRSMATFVKGIKPSRADIKANKEAARKRKATIRQKKADEKKRAEAEAKRWIDLKKSCLQVIESHYYEVCGEYHMSDQYTEYYLYASSPTAFATLKKVLKNSVIANTFSSMSESLKDITTEFKRRGYVMVRGDFKDLATYWVDSKKIQEGYSPEYRFESHNDYTDKSIDVVAYSRNGYKPQDNGCHHCRVEDAEYGPTAERESLVGLFANIARTKKICAGKNYCGDRRMFDPRDFYAICI